MHLLPMPMCRFQTTAASNRGLKPNMTIQPYIVHTICSNCTDIWTYELPHAYLVKDHTCRACGCHTLQATSLVGVPEAGQAAKRNWR